MAGRLPTRCLETSRLFYFNRHSLNGYITGKFGWFLNTDGFRTTPANGLDIVSATPTGSVTPTHAAICTEPTWRITYTRKTFYSCANHWIAQGRKSWTLKVWAQRLGRAHHHMYGSNTYESNGNMPFFTLSFIGVTLLACYGMFTIERAANSHTSV